MQASATENEFLDLKSGALVHVRRMHFLNAAVNGLEIHKDYVKLYDSTRSVESMRAKRNKRYWQTGMFHFDPIMRGYYLDELFATHHINELKITVKTDSAQGAIPILIESVKVVRPDLVK